MVQNTSNILNHVLGVVSNFDMLHIILVESELELIPKEIRNHYVIRKHARKRGKKPEEMILDSSLHFRAMQNLEDFKRRGRPDIVYITLLSLLSSPLNKSGKLRVYVHTRNDEIIFINPKVRLPRHYNRFIGLFEKLLVEKEIRTDEGICLLKVLNMNVEELAKRIKAEKYILLDENASLGINFLKECFLKYKDVAILIGAFPHGDFKHDYKFADRVSIYKERLDTWSVASFVADLYYIMSEKI